MVAQATNKSGGQVLANVHTTGDVPASGWIKCNTDGSTYFGKVTVASGPNDSTAPVIGWALSANGAAGAPAGKVWVMIVPALE